MVRSDVRPFEIAISERNLETLHKKLALATFPEEVEFSDIDKYGASRSEIKRLAEYWENGFDWRAQEAELNKLPQFTTTVNVDGFGDLDIHFIHQRASREDSIPLLFSHGCLSHCRGYTIFQTNFYVQGLEAFWKLLKYCRV